MLNNKIITIIFCTILFSISLNASWWEDAWDDAKKIAKGMVKLTVDGVTYAYDKTADAEKQISQLVKDGIDDIEKLPKELATFVENKLNDLETTAEDEIKSAIETGTISKNIKRNSSTLISTKRLANVTAHVTNKANITSIGAASASFTVGYKKFSETFKVTIGDTDGSTWVNSVKVNNDSRYDIILDSTLSGSGEHVYLGGHNYIGSVIQTSTP